MIRNIELNPQKFEGIWSEKTSSLVLRNKDLYERNDTVFIREFSEKNGYSGRRITAYISHIITYQKGVETGLKKGFCMVSFSGIKFSERKTAE